MTTFGYTLMCEQARPTQLVDGAVRAEQVGFDFAVVSDHYYPWLREQGHAPYAWSVLGAAAYATSRIGLISFVTCPIRRYHPAVVAPSSRPGSSTSPSATCCPPSAARSWHNFPEVAASGAP